jgi:phosphoribosyl 1,2-cyclic phosphodiesterase
MPQIGTTVLASGSNGNCTVVHCGDRALLIDCGISLKVLRERLAKANICESWIKAILVTHEHSDHIGGLDVVARHLGIPVFVTRLCAEALHKKGLDTAYMTVINVCTDFELAGFVLRAFPLQHDAVDPVGYIAAREAVKIGIATDFGKANAMTDYQLRDCSTLVVESNYDINMLAASKREWRLKQRIIGPIGHLSNVDAAEMLPRIVTANTSNVILAHISGDCNKYDIAENTARGALNGLGRSDIFLTCALRESHIPTVWN